MNLQELLERMGVETRSYSGRFMYGKECLAVTLDRDESPYRLMGDIMQDLCEQTIELCDAKQDVDHSDILRAIKNTKMDSLGTGTILYWPTTPYKAS
jgi:hypothetical protein